MINPKPMLIPWDIGGQYPIGYAYGSPQEHIDEWAQGNKGWKLNAPFKALMQVMKMSRGRSAVTFYLQDMSTGTCYPMFAKDFMLLVQDNKIDKGPIQAEWAFVKRGANYGLAQCLPLTDEQRHVCTTEPR